MRSEGVRVRSAVDDRVLFHVGEREARDMCGEDYEGNLLEGVSRVARRLTAKKKKIQDIRFLEAQRPESNSPCTITMGDVMANAQGSATEKLRRRGQQLGRTGTYRIGNHVDRSMTKVEEWPNAHDCNAATVSAGVAIGSFCPVFGHPALQDNYVTFS